MPGAMEAPKSTHDCVFETPLALQRLAESTNVPPWAHVLIDTYFANWPARETQELYKSKNKKCSQYWYHELKRIMNATLHFTPEFCALPFLNYYTAHYTGDTVHVKLMTPHDRTDILRAFTTQLGMHWSIFPYTAHDFD